MRKKRIAAWATPLATTQTNVIASRVAGQRDALPTRGEAIPRSPLVIASRAPRGEAISRKHGRNRSGMQCAEEGDCFGGCAPSQ